MKKCPPFGISGDNPEGHRVKAGKPAGSNDEAKETDVPFVEGTRSKYNFVA